MAEIAPQDCEHSSGEEEKATRRNLSEAQKECLERCLHALKNAKNDSHTLAALFLVSVQGHIVYIHVQTVNSYCLFSSVV